VEHRVVTIDAAPADEADLAISSDAMTVFLGGLFLLAVLAAVSRSPSFSGIGPSMESPYLTADIGVSDWVIPSIAKIANRQGNPLVDEASS
jgi:hypothetical protein